MSSHEPGQSWPPQPGHAPGQHPDGPAYGVVHMVTPTRQPSHRGAWIGAGATLVAAVIGVVGTYLVSTGNDKGPAAAPAPAPTTASPAADATPTRDAAPGADATPTADAATAPAQETTSAAPTGPAPHSVHWQGTLVITYVEDKDLDAAPPVMSEINSDNDFAVYPFGDHMLRPDNGAKALVWKGAKAPTYADCAGVVGTQATSNDIRIKTGLTVCGRTGEGKLLRMTVKEMAGQAGDTNATFDVVVWAGGPA
ncbi:hypothetical protein ACH4OX_32500 [Streptomyces roseolus]|uniref:hypothetical protein n=1 Tax=Streptomyces roseolus TaxID=67358 RepID=UPI0037B244A0